ncbi:protease inhibitor I9 family protein [Micromonospora echinofusca]|uniref:protease inhibitor I9 family protein n=1 Tax=Micromonospora echinofusca TaxID=47858 RepID=UPI00372138F7
MAEWSDPTVYLPYIVEIEREDGEVRSYPAHFVTMTPDFVFVRDPAGGSASLPTRSVRSIRVAVQDLPADHDSLRAEYPNAYQPWHSFDELSLEDMHKSRGTLAYAQLRRRPPAHLVIKARERGYDPTAMLNAIENESKPDPRSLEALYARRSAENDYLVIVKPGIDPYQVLSRHQLSPDNLYRIVASWGFGARLTGLQLEQSPRAGVPALSEDSDIDRIEPDPDRLAPHFRAPQEQRVDGEYIVLVRCSGDPLTVAARAGVSPSRVFDFINSFSADMTDAQVQDLRRDPDVVQIEDNATVGLDC